MNFDDLVARTPLCTIDKTRLIRDFTKDIRLKKRNLGPERQETMMSWWMRPGLPGPSYLPAGLT